MRELILRIDCDGVITNTDITIAKRVAEKFGTVGIGTGDKYDHSGYREDVAKFISGIYSDEDKFMGVLGYVPEYIEAIKDVAETDGVCVEILTMLPLRMSRLRKSRRDILEGISDRVTVRMIDNDKVSSKDKYLGTDSDIVIEDCAQALIGANADKKILIAHSYNESFWGKEYGLTVAKDFTEALDMVKSFSIK